MNNKSKYETIIGLEVHVQLSTKTKIFCSCKTIFGAEPNTEVCPVCLGLPGVLPVLNRKAFEYAIKVALALDCDIQKRVKFDRKNYYYPDLPKNYQISQYDMPLAYNGKIKIMSESGETKKIGVTRVHMEEDAGKLLHDPEKPFSYIDLNRTGTPLLEIVSEPEIESPDEAYRYLTVLKQLIKYLDVSDCNMEEGSLRCDANVSLREKGTVKLGSKVEIKNLNSFKSVRDALIFEERRQEEELGENKKIVQETRLWNEKKNATESMRSKEEAHDYRYFPEPDLVPFEVTDSDIKSILTTVPELPYQKATRFFEKYALGEKDIEVIIAEKETADFFEEAVKYFNSPQVVSNWLKGELLRYVNEKKRSVKNLGISAQDFAAVIRMVEEDILSGLSAKEVLQESLDTGKSPGKIVKEKGLEQVSDEKEIGRIVRKVIIENAKSVNDYKNGKTNALSFLVGRVMSETKGKANPKIAGEILRKNIINS